MKTQETKYNEHHDASTSCSLLHATGTCAGAPQGIKRLQYRQYTLLEPNICDCSALSKDVWSYSN